LIPKMNQKEIDIWREDTNEQLQKWERNGDLARWGVSSQQAALIFWYTLEKPKIYEMTSSVLNDCAKRKNNAELGAVMPFISNFLAALAALPESFDRGPVMAYRGMKYSYPEDVWNTKFRNGQVIVWHTLKSVTLEEANAEGFCGDEPSTIFEIHQCRGKFVQELSKFGADEAEIVLMPGAMFRAESAQRSSTPNRDRVVLTFMDSDRIG